MQLIGSARNTDSYHRVQYVAVHSLFLSDEPKKNGGQALHSAFPYLKKMP